MTASKPRGRYHKDGELKHRLDFARNCGWGRGYHDKHDESRTFETGAEYLAWMAGWREGYAQLKAERRAKTMAKERLDGIMRGMLHDVTKAA